MAAQPRKKVKDVTKIRILIADDHDLVREGLVARLNISDEMEVCGEADNGISALEKAQFLKPDIIFLDISMPGMTGLEVGEKILSVSPKNKIIFLSVYDNPEYIREALRIGAKGYKLSGREKEVLAEIALGVTNKEIAEKLRISVRTVESHRLAIREKTGGGNAAALFKIANELGLV